MTKLVRNTMDGIMTVNSIALIGIGALIAGNHKIEVDMVLLYSIWFFAGSGLLICYYYLLERSFETSPSQHLSEYDRRVLAKWCAGFGVLLTGTGIVLLLVTLFMQAL